jgi:hypothetical protein
MRFLGADPSRPADRVEELVMIELNNQICRELARQQKAS